MGLSGNCCRTNFASGRPWGGTSQSYLPGAYRGTGEEHRFRMQSGATELRRYAQVPLGYYPPATYYMALSAGAIASYQRATLTLAANAAPASGQFMTGAAAISLDATAAGDLVASGGGTASISLSASADIAGVVEGTGTATMTIGASAALDGHGQVGGTAAIAITGSATVVGYGYMTGTTTDPSGYPTADAIAAAAAAAVWGQVMEDGATAAEQFRLMFAALAGDMEIVDNLDGTFAVTFKAHDGATSRLLATIDAAGTRTITGRDPS